VVYERERKGVRDDLRALGESRAARSWCPRAGDLASRTWVFDADTHELIGSGFHNDVEQGPCETWSY
jgi:hypothetical protein